MSGCSDQANYQDILVFKIKVVITPESSFYADIEELTI
jgi:hypothetical protein